MSHLSFRTEQSRTDNRFPVLEVQRAFSVADEERQVKHVLHRLPEVIWIDDELEQVDLFVLVQNFFNLDEA